jgi:DNA-binding winged helix-turn-helix (wHTH) protein
VVDSAKGETVEQPTRRSFGIFEVDLEARELRRNGMKVKLQDRPFQILAVLLENPGRLVTREMLQEKLWPGDKSRPEDFAARLNIAINKLRDTLGDSASNPRFIETLPARGYRFIAEVKGLETGIEQEKPHPIAQPEAGEEGAGQVKPHGPSSTQRSFMPQRTLRIALIVCIVLISLVGLLIEWVSRHRAKGPHEYPPVSPALLLPCDRIPSSPSQSEAQAECRDGLAKLRALNYGEAKDSLLKAVASDPNDALIHAALAEAWWDMGDDADAKAEAKRAFDLSKDLPRDVRPLVEAINREMMDQWEEAALVYQRLWSSSPNKLEYGLLLADAQKEAGRFKDAFGTLNALKNLPPPDQYDPRIELQEADCRRVFARL